MSSNLTRCTYVKKLRMIQSFVQELLHFLCFHFWPPGGQAKNQIGLNLSLVGHVA
jgi:hypothetical protein